ncbi:hypothetical protein CL620_01825 [archaeon]|nr:hypothetical protein [archaeon]
MSCSPLQFEDEVRRVDGQPLEEPAAPTPAPTPTPAPVVAAPQGECNANTDCAQGLFCIDGECGEIGGINQVVGCTKTCTLNQATFSTTDGEEVVLTKGKGTYTAAGAIEWKLMPFPQYCNDEPVKLPLALLKKNRGVVIEEQVITISKGEQSASIGHPNITRIDFKVTLQDITEQCN